VNDITSLCVVVVVVVYGEVQSWQLGVLRQQLVSALHERRRYEEQPLLEDYR
jgi:hypothetical protein